MKKINILVTGVGGNIGQGVIKALKRSNLDSRIIGVDCNPLSAGFFASDERYIVPSVKDPGMTDELIRIIKKEKIDYVIVASDQEVEVYIDIKDRIEKETSARIIMSSKDVIRITTDKYLTAEFLRENGFPYIESVLYSDKKGLSDFLKKHPFPLLIKPKIGYGSKNVFIVNNEEELHVFGKRIQDAMIQTIAGEEDSEYTAAVVYFKDGPVFEHIIFRRELHGGTTYRAEVVEDEEMTRQVRRIVECLDPFGPCNVQFRYVDGKVVVFEVNPRFSGTTSLRSLIGFNDVEMTLNYIVFNKCPEKTDVKRAVILRYWNELAVLDTSENMKNKKAISDIDFVINDVF